MTYLVYTNTIKDIASPITVEAEDVDFDPNGAIDLYVNTQGVRRTVAVFAPGVWIAVLPVTPKGEK